MPPSEGWLSLTKFSGTSLPCALTTISKEPKAAQNPNEVNAKTSTAPSVRCGDTCIGSENLYKQKHENLF